MITLEHVGLAVRDAAAVQRLFESLAELRVYKSERIPREGVETHFLSAGGTKLELLAALGSDSPVARFLENRGEGLHHLAFEVSDITEHMRLVRSLGFTPLTEEALPGADDKLIFFLHPKETAGILLEFCESKPIPLADTAILHQGERFAFRERGDRTHSSVVVIPGIGAGPSVDVPTLVRHLELHFHVIALHIPDRQAIVARESGPDLVFSLLDARSVSRAHVFGCGAGGHIALQCAMDQPLRVRRLALFGMPPGNGGQSWSAITHDALVAGVDRDEMLLPRVTLDLHEALAGSRLTILPGTTHALEGRLLAHFAQILVRHYREV